MLTPISQLHISIFYFYIVHSFLLCKKSAVFYHMNIPQVIDSLYANLVSSINQCSTK